MRITDELRKEAQGNFRYLYTSGQEKHLLAIADRIDAEHEAMLADARKTVYEGYIELPKDANGEHVHIGDVMEWLDEPHHPITVVGVGKSTLFYIDDDANAQWTMAKTKRHHAKTVEDVLREMLDAWGELPSNATNEAIIAEYAAKLRLAESEES